MNIKDAVWGFIVGDALGVPYEFSTRKMMKENPATDMMGFGTYNQPPGTWSDDTSMMLCVLENMLNKGSVDDLANLFLSWYKDDCFTPHGELFDIGITTSTALGNLMRGVDLLHSGLCDEMSAGNGSIMRCLPYAFIGDNQAANVKMKLESEITHKNDLCYLSSLFYIKMMRSLLEGNSKDQALETTRYYFNSNKERLNDKKEWMYKFERLFHPQFSELSEDEIQSTGYVISTLEAVVWCFLNTENYRDAVLKAVNLGSDTDTIAALTGGLAGLYYGYDTIPEKWINQIAAPKMINKILGRINPQEKFIPW